MHLDLGNHPTTPTCCNHIGLDRLVSSQYLHLLTFALIVLKSDLPLFMPESTPRLPSMDKRQEPNPCATQLSELQRRFRGHG